MILNHDITSSEELKKLIETKELKIGDAFAYRCQKCGAYVAKRVTKMSNKNKEKFYVLWCQKCKNKHTNLMKWGEEEKMKSPAFQKILKQGMINKYGVEYALQVPELKEKAQNTTEEHFGENPFSSPEMIKRIKEGNMKNYGVEWALQNPEVRKKGDETMIENYGVPNLFYSQQFQENLKNDIEKAKGKGIRNPSQVPKIQCEVRSTINKKYNGRSPSYKYLYDGVYFDSSWELAVWIYAINNNIQIEREPVILNFTYNGKNHCVVPDFRINGKLVEIKGTHLMKTDKNGNIIPNCPYSKGSSKGKEYTQEELNEMYKFNSAKFNCEMSNGVEFWGKQSCKQYVAWVELNFGKGYLESFRVKNDKKEIKKYHKAIEINDQEKINNINNCSTWDKPENRKYKLKPGTHNSVNVNEKRRRIVASGRKVYN